MKGKAKGCNVKEKAKKMADGDTYKGKGVPVKAGFPFKKK